jgi:hypothetical protein
LLADRRFLLTAALAAVLTAAGVRAQPACDGLSNCLEVLQSDDKATKIGAIISLATLKNKNATAPLLEVVKNAGDFEVRRSAVRALGVIKDPQAIAPLTAYVRDGAIGRDAVDSIVKIGGKPAVRALIGALTVQPMQVAVAQGLGELGDPASKPALLKLYKTTKDDRTRGVAALALQRIRAIWGPDASEMGLPLYPKADYIPNERADWVFLTSDSLDQVASFYQKALRRPPMSFAVFRQKYEAGFGETKDGQPARIPEKIFVAEEQEFGGKKYPAKMIFLQSGKETEIWVVNALE